MSRSSIPAGRQLPDRLRCVASSSQSGALVWPDRFPAPDAMREAGGLEEFLSLLLAGLTAPALRTVVPDRVGYGSIVTVQDVEGGWEATHIVMSGSAMDFDAGHISLESPLGQALLGRKPGEVVVVAKPSGSARIRLLKVVTLPEIIEEVEAYLEGPSKSHVSMAWGQGRGHLGGR